MPKSHPLPDQLHVADMPEKEYVAAPTLKVLDATFK